MRVLLMCMPWATTQRPSIALGILTRLCAEAGVPVRTFYPNMDMVDAIGFEAAGRFADERSIYGLTEHLFAVDLWGREALHSDEYLEGFARAVRDDPTITKWSGPFRPDPESLKRLRDEVLPRFLDAVLARVLAESPTVVGFTATFNQVMASLALAGRIKRALPSAQVIAGGACFDGEMGQEYHRGAPHALDHVFLGEAETPFREYLRRLKAGEPTRGIPGVTSFVDGRIELLPGEPLADLAGSPMPNYDDFFAEKERKLNESGTVFNAEYLPFESSRGCWWGQKNHCVFCGINPDLMRFRAKEVDQVVRELAMLSARYGVTRFTATDWIMSRWHCDELFRRVAALGLDFEIFYEVRSDLTKAQLIAMKAAGVTQAQPGIESLSTPLLKLMRKGTTAIKQVQFLRWAKEVGIDISYNLLAGIPDEQARWYLEMAQLIPRLRHLQPPCQDLDFLEMHRFSPLHRERDRFGVDEHALRADYRSNFPAGAVDPLKVGYFFQFHSTRTVAESGYVDVVRREIQPWIAAHQEKAPPVYEYRIGAGFLRVTDKRQPAGRCLWLSGLSRDVVLLCDAVQTRAALAHDLEGRWPAEVADGSLDRVLEELLAADVLLAEDDHLLTLPIGHRPRATTELRAHVLGAEAAGDGPERDKVHLPVAGG